jgi:glutamine amidotransferase
MAWSGNPILLEALLFEPRHSLIDQSHDSRASRSPTNADGFGVGWYREDERHRPGLFRSIRPAWNDANLRDLAWQIRAPMVLAHIRAASHGPVQESNCHPFRHRNWLFVHNGSIPHFPELRRELMLAVAPALFAEVAGTTDSEVMFHLAMTFGLFDDPCGGLARMTGLVEQVISAHDIDDPMDMTLGLTDGHAIYAVRYASAGEAPSLFHSRKMEDVYHLNPDLRTRVSAEARVVVSEPFGTFADAWVPVPAGSFLEVRDGSVTRRDFVPEVPETAGVGS